MNIVRINDIEGLSYVFVWMPFCCIWLLSVLNITPDFSLLLSVISLEYGCFRFVLYSVIWLIGFGTSLFSCRCLLDAWFYQSYPLTKCWSIFYPDKYPSDKWSGFGDCLVSMVRLLMSKKIVYVLFLSSLYLYLSQIFNLRDYNSDLL